MQAILKLGLFCLCVTLGSAAKLSKPNLLRASDQTLLQFMVSSRSLQQNNPQRSLSCFDYYVPILNAITEEYERSYAICLQQADEERNDVYSKTKDERTAIEDSAYFSCKLLSSCTYFVDSIEYFECFERQGSENAKAMYGISANASDILTDIREEYRLIDNREYKCTNASERIYLQDSAQTYEELQSCLLGKTQVPAPTPEPTTESTPESTTDSRWGPTWEPNSNGPKVVNPENPGDVIAPISSWWI